MPSSLLARFAQNIFWMARYIERAENIARILDINETYAREAHGEPDWQRVLELYSDTERFFESHDTADSAAVLNFYILERDNPTSIAAAVRMARENARSVRHLISTEMWTHLNVVHARIAGLTQRDLRLSQVSRRCAEIKEACQTFEGITEGTFFRGSARCFYSMGKYIERADQTTRVLQMGYERLTVSGAAEDAISTVQWNALLRSVAAYHAFRSLHPSGLEPRTIAAFLLYDHGFPRAVALCVDRVTQLLEVLVERHDLPRHEDIDSARNHLVFTLNTGLGEKVTRSRLHVFLDKLQLALTRLSGEITRYYFKIH